LKKALHIVLNEFKPDNRVLKEALTLGENGYDVSIAALMKNDRKEIEDLNKAKIYRIKLWTNRFSNNPFFQFFKYLEYTCRLIKKFDDVDIVHCHDVGPLPIAFLYKLIKNKNLKIIYDAHEYEAYTHNLKSVKKLFIQIVEKLFIKKVDRMITVSESIANAYSKEYLIDKPTVVYNAPRYEQIEGSNIFREKFNIPNEHTIFLYQGLLGQGRGIENTLEVFKQLKNENVSVIFMGYGPFKEEIEEASIQNHNIFYQPFVHPDELLKYTASADYGLNLSVNTCLSRFYALPNKLFEYCVAKIPSIVSDHHERGKFVRENEIGFVVKDNDIDDFILSIKKAHEIDKSYFDNNIEKVSKKYNWEMESKKLLDSYRSLDAKQKDMPYIHST